MKTLRNHLTALFVAAIAIVGVTAANAQTRNEREVRDAVRSLSTKIDNFDYDLRYQLNSASVNTTVVSQVGQDISELKDAVRDFRNNFDRRRENRDDIRIVVEAAKRVDRFMLDNQQNRRLEDDWSEIKAQIDRLASNYGVTNDWSMTTNDDDRYNYPDDRPMTGNTVMVGLSGTYDLDLQRSERIDDIIARSNTSGNDREELKDKLTAPARIALDIRGDQVTLATSTATPVSFRADGQQTTETDAAGRTIRLRATLTDGKLVISSIGGDSDYTITFESTRNGREMRVLRRITTSYLNQTVFAESVYNKTDQVARLGIDTGNYGSTGNNGGYSDNDQNNGNPGYGNYPPSPRTPRTGRFIVPDRTTITGILENDINTKVSQNNDRFRMTVQSPNDFRGATIEGYISGVGRSGRVSGRSNVTFNFERITLRNGEVYDFAGSLSSVRDQNGKEVKVDTEGTAKGDSQTKESVKRGGIGAGIGAVIGAIAGGIKGAAIGAIIGGGAGAGSVVLQGRDDIELMKGSTITVISSSPVRNDPQSPR
ncbi:MAG: hypothetical protein UZ17_ACD001002178 [Acidobacteria bacterium OLB17]|nr:MAG: hypothetical protein UZ17_ACD001002178 [Acidobacteria bacterium OLB17]MCZ2390789.1 hypothetical protein [Acidobacteriota bacterium]